MPDGAGMGSFAPADPLAAATDRQTALALAAAPAIPEPEQASPAAQWRPRGGAEGDTAEADASEAVAAAAANPPRSGARPASRTPHRPFLVAAAVAGAVIAATPFLASNGKDHMTQSDGQDLPDPVAAQPGGGSGSHSDGFSTHMPVQHLRAGGGHGSGAGGILPVVQEPDVPAAVSAAEDSRAAHPTHHVRAATGAVGAGAAVPARTAVAGHAHGSHVTAAVDHGHTAVAASAARTVLTAVTKTASSTAHSATAPAKTVPAAVVQAVRTTAPAHPPTTPARPAASVPTVPADPGVPAVPDQIATTVPALNAASGGAAVPSVPAVPAEAGTPAAPPGPADRMAAPGWSTKVVGGATVLHSGESVATTRTRLTVHEDGDLVISDENGMVRWSSHTTGQGNFAVFEADGDLVVRSPDHTTLWHSGTGGHSDAQLVLQNDGNVTILAPSGQTLWAAGTQH
ncbi:hypothetical protein [Streptomyces sp. NPDC007856]|uniref:hypothetical protein n=1 Tax=Streptomyces sp. NPDC007856 TaxID=3364781 RepID=UPI0036C16CAA